MTEERYRTVVKPGVAGFRIHGSRFLCRIEEVETVDAAECVISAEAADHPDATHVVPAYRIRTDPVTEYSSDAGEPAGSAGAPVLSVLKGADLENVVAVVIRYYGGRKLGIGGLVRAYGEAAKRAIADTAIVERQPMTTVVIETEYDDSGTVRSVLEQHEVAFEATYEEVVRFAVQVPLTEEASLRDHILSATSGRAAIQSN